VPSNFREIGALQTGFEKLKQKLKAEGLFERERKRPLPVTRDASAWLRHDGAAIAMCFM